MLIKRIIQEFKHKIISNRLLIVLSFLLFTIFSQPRSVEALSVLSNELGLSPAPLPRYRVGTKFIYSNGTWETITRIGPEGVTWMNQSGSESTGISDFTYQRHKWKTKRKHGIRFFRPTEYLFSKTTTTLWPLQKGKKTRFDVINWWRYSSGRTRIYDTYWSCEVEGTERISVVAGDFDTWRIVCRRYPSKFRTTSKTREYRTWHYAPSINHWVLEVRDYNGFRENRRKELTAILPNLDSISDLDEEIVSIKKQFQNSLESSKIGKIDIWENQSGRKSISITPKKSFKHENGNICRQYQQIISDSGETHEYAGIACRNSFGRWIVPKKIVLQL